VNIAAVVVLATRSKKASRIKSNDVEVWRKPFWSF